MIPKNCCSFNCIFPVFFSFRHYGWYQYLGYGIPAKKNHLHFRLLAQPNLSQLEALCWRADLWWKVKEQDNVQIAKFLPQFPNHWKRDPKLMGAPKSDLWCSSHTRHSFVTCTFNKTQGESIYITVIPTRVSRSIQMAILIALIHKLSHIFGFLLAWSHSQAPQTRHTLVSVHQAN